MSFGNDLDKLIRIQQLLEQNGCSFTQDQLLEIYKQFKQDEEQETIDGMEVPVNEEAARCYIDRYRDIKLHVENMPAQDKIRWVWRHYQRFGRDEGRVWGCREEPIPTDSDFPHINTAGSGMLWKPVADSRGGIPVVLTPRSWNQVPRVRLFQPGGGEINIPGGVEERGPTNGDRETYFFHGIKAHQLPKNMSIDFDQHGRFLVPDPTLRYE